MMPTLRQSAMRLGKTSPRCLLVRPCVPTVRTMAQARKHEEHKEPSKETAAVHVPKEAPQAPARREMMDPFMTMSPFRRMTEYMDEMRREMDALSNTFGLGELPLMTRSPLSMLADPFLAMPELPMIPEPSTMLRRMIPVEVAEQDKQYVFTAEVPGLTPKDIKVSVDPETRMMTISGSKRSEEKGTAAPGPAAKAAAEGSDNEAPEAASATTGPPATRRQMMSFMRSFRLPPDCNLEAEHRATVKDGLLHITVPKVEPVAKPAVKEIPVM